MEEDDRFIDDQAKKGGEDDSWERESEWVREDEGREEKTGLKVESYRRTSQA